MSLHIAKLFKTPVTLAGAAFLVHVAAATAADALGDVQQQARNLLIGPPTAHHALQPGGREDNSTVPAADAQQSARQLLLGPADNRATAAQKAEQAEIAEGAVKTESRKRVLAHGDAQAAARQLLLGEHRGTDAPKLAARPTR